jgi:hypothetical protein
MTKKATAEQMAKMEEIYQEIKKLTGVKKDHHSEMVHFLQIIKDISIINSFTTNLETGIRDYNSVTGEGSMKVKALMEQAIDYYK